MLIFRLAQQFEAVPPGLQPPPGFLLSYSTLPKRDAQRAPGTEICVRKRTANFLRWIRLIYNDSSFRPSAVRSSKEMCE